MSKKTPTVAEGEITYQIIVHHESSYSCKVTHTLTDRLAMLHFVKEHVQLALHEDSAKTDKKKRMTAKERDVLAAGNAAVQIMISQIYPSVYKQIKDLSKSDQIEEPNAVIEWFAKLFVKIRDFFFRFK